MKLSGRFEQDKQQIRKLLQVQKSFDLIERPLWFGGKKSCLYFVDGFVKDEVMQRILQAFFEITPEAMQDIASAQEFMEAKLSYVEVSTEQEVELLATNILSGPSVLIIDGFDTAIVIDIRTYPVRGIEEPEKEKVLRGSRDGFVETIVFNTALIRRRIRDPHLVFEMVTVGARSKTDVAIGYISDFASPKLVEELKKRIKQLRVKALDMGEESLAECIIKGSWINPFPKVRYTERPDVAAASLLDGKVVVMVDNSPSVMVLPTTLFDFIQEPDDYYYPPLVGGYLRFIRNAIFLSTLFLTPLWLLLIQNPSLLPPWLSFIQVSDPVHVPILLQLIILELATDGLKLASLNTPSTLSNSLSIIGALLLGDFAVQVGWFVPQTILYMAYVTIAGFAQPSVELNYAVKFMRILLLLLTAWLGIWGFVGGLALISLIVAFNKTLSGEGYLYPLIPFHWQEFKVRVLRMKIRSKKS